MMGNEDDTVFKMAAPTGVEFVVVVVLFLTTASVLFLKMNEIQPSPYMDEIFHIPQAQRYCNGSFTEWDPNITTLPGLYLASAGLLKPIAELWNIDLVELCTTSILRYTNVLFAAGNTYLMFSLLQKIHMKTKGTNSYKPVFTAAALGHLPLLYFYTFLYYTEAGSTFCILLMYLLSLCDNHLLASLIGACAVVFRQTNIVWVVFTAGVTFAKMVQKDGRKGSSRSILHAINSSIRAALTYIVNLNNLLYTILILLPYALVVVCFIAFVIINGSIVVGHHSHHTSCLHLPQLFYFASFTGFFGFPYMVSLKRVTKFFRFVLRNPFTVAILLGLAIVFVRNFTYTHEFLLADNRHYVFYFWRKIYQRHHLIRYLLIPGYLYVGWCIWDYLAQQSELWHLVYFVCLCGVVVPQRLIEFRYFIAPYLMFRLHMPLQSYWKISIELLFYSAVNAFTLYMFMSKPFVWSNEPGLQRFMW